LSRLGSSKNRSAEQTEESKEVVKDLIGDTTDTTIVAFTDGSCQGNPGPCGMFFDWILAISLTAISSILRSTGSMLPSTSIASLPDVAGNPKHIGPESGE
jgi:hypothetical protein